MSFTCFNTVVREKVAFVEIDLARKANCMTREFWDELPLLMSELEGRDDVAVVVISGSGKHFSSGIDAKILVDIMENDSDDKTAYIEAEIRKMQLAISSVEACSKPVIAAIHGACVGGGVDLITACDIRMSTYSAAFCVLETKLGIVADLGTLQRLPKLVGEQLARELSYSSRLFTGYKAKKFGLVRSLHFTKDKLLKAALVLAKEFAQMPLEAVSGTKKSLNFSRDHSVEDGLIEIARENSINLQSEQTAEQIKKLKKRLSKSN